jgi:hypothetical protein
LKSKEDDFADRFIYALKAPFITWPLCETSITTEMQAKAKMYRLMMTATAETMIEATEFEAMLYIMSATLANPPSHTWYKIYTHLFQKYFPEQSATVFAGEPIEKVQDYEFQDLKRLQQWIFKKQMEHLKELEKKAKAVIKEPAKPKVEQTTFPLS